MAKKAPKAAATETSAAPVTPVTPAPKKEPVDRAAATAASWTDPAIAAARKTRTAVEVEGVQYKSIAEAFKALALPLNRHVKFRSTLKKSADGRAEFKHGDQAYEFLVVIPSEAEPAATA